MTIHQLVQVDIGIVVDVQGEVGLGAVIRSPRESGERLYRQIGVTIDVIAQDNVLMLVRLALNQPQRLLLRVTRWQPQ